MMRSASVDLPWSMWAMMEKFRMWSMETADEASGRSDNGEGVVGVGLRGSQSRGNAKRNRPEPEIKKRHVD
jgi:hypothetical protein